jgi:hypothetical protein
MRSFESRFRDAVRDWAHAAERIAAARLPVRGSSSFGVGGGGGGPEPRSQGQRVPARKALGYADLEPPRHPLAWQLANRLCDGVLALRSRASHLARELTGRG